MHWTGREKSKFVTDWSDTFRLRILRRFLLGASMNNSHMNRSSELKITYLCQIWSKRRCTWMTICLGPFARSLVWLSWCLSTKTNKWWRNSLAVLRALLRLSFHLCTRKTLCTNWVFPSQAVQKYLMSLWAVEQCKATPTKRFQLWIRDETQKNFWTQSFKSTLTRSASHHYRQKTGSIE